MKRNIDLTLNGDFQKPKNVINSRRSLLDLVKTEIPMMNKRSEDNLIKNSESETNFLTGSFNSINSRSYRLKMARNMDNIECSCERCGGYLFIKENTLCNKCENQLDAEIMEDEVMRLFNIIR